MQQKRKHILLTITIVVIAFSAIATTALITQAPPQAKIATNCPVGLHNSDPSLLWERAFGGAGDDRAFGIAETGDGYLVVGSSTSFVANHTVAWILWLDLEGNQVWNRTYMENYGMEFRTISRLQDGFLVVGNTFLESGGVCGVVMKLNSQGTPIWNVTLQACEGLNKLFSGMNDGSALLVTGLTEPLNASASSGWLVKLSAKGEILWSKTFGGSVDTAMRGVAVTGDGGYVAAGYVDYAGNGNYDFLAMKFGSAGNLLWNKTYGGPQSDLAYSVTSSPGGCVVAGNTYSYGAGDSDAWIIKIDLDGNLLWSRTVGGMDYDSPSYITASQNGGYLVTGTTFSFGNGNRDFWLFSVDNSGNVQWSFTVGRAGYEEAYGVVCAGGSNYVLAGWTNSIGAGGRYDFYVVKVTAGSG